MKFGLKVRMSFWIYMCG